MDNRRVASELVKLAKQLVGRNRIARDYVDVTIDKIYEGKDFISPKLDSEDVEYILEQNDLMPKADRIGSMINRNYKKYKWALGRFDGRGYVVMYGVPSANVAMDIAMNVEAEWNAKSVLLEQNKKTIWQLGKDDYSDIPSGSYRNVRLVVNW